MNYLTADQVSRVVIDDHEPTYGHNVDGYGRKIPTAYRLVCTDGRTRRVYVVCFSNSGSAYVVIGGEPHYLSTDVEHMIEIAREV